jgi:hypothetical protein
MSSTITATPSSFSQTTHIPFNYPHNPTILTHKLHSPGRVFTSSLAEADCDSAEPPAKRPRYNYDELPAKQAPEISPATRQIAPVLQWRKDEVFRGCIKTQVCPHLNDALDSAEVDESVKAAIGKRVRNPLACQTNFLFLFFGALSLVCFGYYLWLTTHSVLLNLKVVGIITGPQSTPQFTIEYIRGNGVLSEEFEILLKARAIEEVKIALALPV